MNATKPQPGLLDLCVLIGRFQPFHTGHLRVLQQGLDHAQRVCVLVGSAGAPRSHRNPWTWQERSGMILSSLPADQAARLVVRPLPDAEYNDTQWVQSVQDAVAAVAGPVGSAGPGDQAARIALIGHSKDHSSFYLRRFPQWGAVEAPNHRGLSGTPMREAYFSSIRDMWLADCDGHKPGDLPQDHLVPPAVRRFLTDFAATPDYAAVAAEYEFLRGYRAQWAGAPYPPVFVTVDACVVQSGHVLLVRRRAMPGRGLWALPGGFLGQAELIEDATLRELREETRLRVPEAVLRGSVVAREVFDAPHRSARGRTVTHASLIHLRPDTSLPAVKGSRMPAVEGADDADQARWWPLAAVKPAMMFEDHHAILHNLVGRL